MQALGSVRISQKQISVEISLEKISECKKIGLCRKMYRTLVSKHIVRRFLMRIDNKVGPYFIIYAHRKTPNDMFRYLCPIHFAMVWF